MSKKLEKLREVNAQLNGVLKKLETHIFIEKIGDAKDKKMITEQPKVAMQIK